MGPRIGAVSVVDSLRYPIAALRGRQCTRTREGGLTRTEPCELKPRRCARKIFDGRGLYLLVMPNGSRCWRYNYRFEGKLKTLALGIHPDVSLDRAMARHPMARSLLADGIDPSARKRALGKYAFVAPAC